MAHNKGRAGHRWRKLAAQVKAEETTCWLCNEPVDKSLRFPNPRAPSVDHIIELDKAPHLLHERSNTRLAHFGCNARRGAIYGNAKRDGPQTKHSRQW